MPVTVATTPSSDVDINGLLGPAQWSSSAITVSFPTAASNYGAYSDGSGEPTEHFLAFYASYQAAALSALSEISSFANLTFVQVQESDTVHAEIRFGLHDPGGSSVHAYYPADGSGGDVWLNNGGPSSVALGGSTFDAIIHELGHALGLKHGHESPAMSVAHDSNDYSVMTYINFVGGPDNNFSVEQWGYPQSYMIYDIATFQYIYGANYSSNSGDTRYSWSPTIGQEFIDGVGQAVPGANRIFETIWDGGGTDTYDFSNYTSDLSVDLRPGGWTITSASQLAQHTFDGAHPAIGNIANALEFDGDPRSLIENAIGGSGADRIEGNSADNVLTGGPGNDSLDGGDGRDTAAFSASSAMATVARGAGQSWTVNAGPDGIDTVTNVELLQFADMTLSLIAKGLYRNDFAGDGASELLIANASGAVVLGMVSTSASSSYHTIAALGPEWQFRGEGDFLHHGRSQFLIENGNGAVVLGDVTDAAAAFTQVAALGPEWKFRGVGDFQTEGGAQFLIQNTVGAVVVGDIRNGQAHFTTVGGLGPEWSVREVGDFLNHGQSDFIIENTSGVVDVGEVVAGAAHYSQVAGLGPEWVFVGVGDFIGDGRSAFLIENTTGAVVAGEVLNGQASYTGIAALGPEWKFVGAGDYLGEGHDQFLIENTSGAVDVGDWRAGQIHYLQVGALGTEWSFH